MSRPRRLPFVLAAVVALALPGRLAAQLREARVLSAEAARRALAAAEAEARKNRWDVSIAVVDAYGELAAFLRLDGAPPLSIELSRAKARTAARFRRPTRALDSSITAGRMALLAADNGLPMEGGVPIVIDGVVVGAVGVSGVTSQQDAVVAAAGAGAVRP
jgi:uncharacterized protein GlcG (DUF336 family)